MNDYEKDEALQEVHDEMYRREEERPTSGFANLSDQTKFFFGIFVAAIILLVANDKITFQNGMFSLIAMVVVLYFMSGTESSQRKELTWMECMIRANDLMKFIQKHPIGDGSQIPIGKINVKAIGRKQFYEGKSFKRSYGVDIYDAAIDITEHYFIEVDVFTGDIITFKHSPEGVYGDETKDIKLMPTYDMLVQKKRDQYLNKKT